MKKLIYFIAGVVFSLSMTAFAITITGPTPSFTDSDTFDSWYSDAVNRMAQFGVISGYPDGSFRPENNVNRAEMVVMLDNYRAASQARTTDLLMNLNRAQDYDLDPDIQVALALAASHRSPYDGDPIEEGQTVGKIEDPNIPANYEVYEGPFNSYWVHLTYQGPYPESGGDMADIDQWYGQYWNTSFPGMPKAE